MNFFLKVDEFADTSAHIYLLAGVNNGNARRIISPILKTFKAVQKDFFCLVISYVADYSAHNIKQTQSLAKYCVKTACPNTHIREIVCSVLPLIDQASRLTTTSQARCLTYSLWLKPCVCKKITYTLITPSFRLHVEYLYIALSSSLVSSEI